MARLEAHLPAVAKRSMKEYVVSVLHRRYLGASAPRCAISSPYALACAGTSSCPSLFVLETLGWPFHAIGKRVVAVGVTYHRASEREADAVGRKPSWVWTLGYHSTKSMAAQEAVKAAKVRTISVFVILMFPYMMIFKEFRLRRKRRRII